MTLQTKLSAFFAILVICLVAAVLAIGLYSFREYSIRTATEHIRSAAEIIRVNLTEAMINGVIDKRENLLQRLVEVPGLKSVRVVRGPQVEQQFGKGLVREQVADALERQVLGDGEAAFELLDDDTDATFRGTIPFVATTRGNPNCLQCHQVVDGSVLGAVTITMSIQHLKRNAMVTLSMMIGAVALFSLVTLLVLRRLTNPIVSTAVEVERAVRRAIDGDFTSRVEVKTGDEIGKIGADMNRLLTYLNEGLNRIGGLVAHLTNHNRSLDGGNLLNTTIEMVETLSQAAHFKQAIEEDETKAEIYLRLAVSMEHVFGIRHYSIYEVLPTRNQMLPMIVDGEPQAACRWCDPQILVRNETCRARRTGHIVDGMTTPGICFAFAPPPDKGDYRHICFPIMQSGAVGSVLQIVVPPDQQEHVAARVPHIGVYLRESAPVLEAKRLMETLRESTLRDPMTGLHNRRFLEESVDTLIGQAQRRKCSIAFMMLDLDYFKMVNDTYGHDAGDAVLKALAKLLKQSVRASDFVIRYGGEEFLILLQETNAATANEVAEKIRAAVAELKVQTSGGMLQKTISIGIASFPEDSDTFWQAVKFADVALYNAKETGRNKVVRFTKALWEENKKDY
ncbi:MAG: response regulator [Rhodocyclales bacterium RIFCSPLOWO2_02_FULL_63_24]|nr:MAG: response regulator [Rhodocyclales bacterium RIFCSPLOWO2_02_FULL_63_24]